MMQTDPSAQAQVAALEAAAIGAAQSGRDSEADALWRRILEIQPHHIRTLSALGQRAFRRGDFPSARSAFQQIVEADGSSSEQWVHLALACRELNDEAAQEAATQRALVLEPKNLVALILRANLLERQGKTHEAARASVAVAQASPPLDRLRPELRPAVSHALAYHAQYGRELAAFLDRQLEPLYETFAGEKLNRFRDSLDIMVGRKRRYESRSELYHYPGLPAIEFFDRADFPWLDAMEAATNEIREEFIGILQAEEGFTPYISYPPGTPLNQWAELNNSPRWSAFHLYKMGMRVDANAAKCPKTMAALAAAPQPDQPGRTPSAMFSLLKPRTRIPPHNGVTNARLVTHLPLIIPEGCGFRVGNETRVWVPGRAWVFDDTIEHEAWNDSDKVRVVLIFDIWHPHLTAPERALITALTVGVNAFTGVSEPGGL